MKQQEILKVRGEFYDAAKQPWDSLLEGVSEELILPSHFNAGAVDEAVHLLQTYSHKKTKVVGGCTDMIRTIRQKYLPLVPDVLVNIKTIPGLDFIKEENGVLRIGALTRLSDIETSELVQAGYDVLSKTAGVVGSPQIRNMATIAGSLCQDIRCWYYTAMNNYYPCWRKGGEECHAVAGDNRWMFGVFGSPEGCACHATCQSDMAVTLTALGASVKTTQRIIPLEQLFTLTLPGTVLNTDEIITEVQIPSLAPGAKAIYEKYSIRKSIDHPLISVAGVASNGEIKIVVGGVHIKPYVVEKVTELLSGRQITEALAEEAGEVSMEDAIPMSMNAWKIEVAKVLVKRTVLNLL